VLLHAAALIRLFQLSIRSFTKLSIVTHVAGSSILGTVFLIVLVEKRTMKKYLLLRKNGQSGPYTIEQMKSIGLFSQDLIWIEKESTRWRCPEEIEELKLFITCEENIPVKNYSHKNDMAMVVSEQKQLSDEASRFHNANDNVTTKADIRPVEFRENYRTSTQTRPIWKKRMTALQNISGIALVYIGVLLGAIIIKKLVDGTASDPRAVTEATPVIDRQPTVSVPNEDYKNALVTEIVPVYKSTTPKTSTHTDVKKQLELKTNEYKVGLFGGINGLQLTVFNTSDMFVDKVIVALDYLTPNGAVVQSEDVLFTSIKPKDAQTIAIPGSNRGVKVRYKILKVFSHNYKADLKQA
jgi:hypothetical protein